MNQTVLITGATGGIGKEMTTLYAKRGYHLVLVSRDMTKLKKLKNELVKNHGITVDIFAVDLSQDTAAKELITFVREMDIDIAINNAGVGLYGEFIQSDIDKINAMNSLNITSLVTLTYFFARKMAQKGNGKILNIASTAAFQPIPNFAAYAASKAFVLYFSEALNFELKPKGVTVSALCPGATATNFDKESNASDTKLFKDGVMEAKEVASIGIKQLDDNVMTKVAGKLNTLKAFASSINPMRGLAVKIANLLVN